MMQTLTPPQNATGEQLTASADEMRARGVACDTIYSTLVIENGTMPVKAIIGDASILRGIADGTLRFLPEPASGKRKTKKKTQTPQAAPADERATVAIMDIAPAVVNRPLCLRGGSAYLATWLHLQITRHTTTDDEGREVVLAKPEVQNSRTLAILRDDGELFIGDGYPQLDAKPLTDLGLDVSLPYELPGDRVLSGAGLKRYRAGYRPDPANVFECVVDVVDRFLDFDHSLAAQATMCEMVACFVLASYCLDAFEIAPYIWPSGDRGSGKTTLLQVVAEMSYLGVVILAGGTYASLRDLSDYGAVLAFDDAENLAGGKRNQDRVDPDKRALLLAGNRRGSFVTVKEPADAKGKTWRTRYVSTFCPRAFAAIQLPDPVLASRTIVVPLVPTIDRQKANSSPVDYRLWPHDRYPLLDALWLLALGGLRELRAAPPERCGSLTGRPLEPWANILAVAHFLEQRGVTGLADRMLKLAQDYQVEKVDLETFSVTPHIVRALADLAQSADDPMMITAGGIALRVKELTSEDEGGDAEDGLTLSPKTVGRYLRSLRLPKKLPRERNRGPYYWRVSKADIARMCAVYGLKDTPSPSNSAEGANSANGAEPPPGAPFAPFAPCAPFAGEIPQMAQQTAQDPWEAVEVGNGG
jgi:hypothetical protein